MSSVHFTNNTAVRSVEGVIRDARVKRFLEGNDFSRVLGMFKEQEKRSKIINNVKGFRHTFLLKAIAKGLYDDIKRVYTPIGPKMECILLNNISKGFYKDVEIMLLYRKIKKISANYLNVKPQGGWDPLGTKALAESIRYVAQEATSIENRIGVRLDSTVNSATNLINSNVSRFESKIDSTVSHLDSTVEQTVNMATNVINSNVANVVQSSNEMTSTIIAALDMLSPQLNHAVSSVENLANNGIKVNLPEFNIFSNLANMLNDPLQLTVALGFLYLVIEFIDHHYEIEHMNYVKVMIAGAAIFKCGTAMKDLFLGWIKINVETRPQSNWSDWLQVAGQGIIFAVFGCTMDFTTLNKSIKSLCDASTNSIKLQEIFTSILDWFKKTAGLVCQFFGYEVHNWFKSHDDVIDRLLTKINDLNAKYIANPMDIGLDFVQEVTRLLMEVNDYSRTVPVNSKNTPVLMAIKSIQDKLSRLQYAMSGIGLNVGDRCEPTFRVFASAPGVGKTYFSAFEQQYIVMAFAETPEEIVQAMRDWNSEVYPWPLENKHHDMYRGQRIIAYPDLFCQTDAEGVVGEPASIVYIIGDQVMTLAAADINKKQKLQVVSDVVTANTNVLMIHRGMFKSIRNPDALIRRMNDFGWFMYVNPKYAKRTPNGGFVVDPTTQRVKGYETEDYLYAGIDRNKVPEGVDHIPEDCYLFRRFDFSTGTFMNNQIFTQKMYLKYLVSYIKEKKMSGQKKKDLLKAQMQYLANKRIAEIEAEKQGLPQTDDLEIMIDPNWVPAEPEELTDYDLKPADVKRLDREKMSDMLLTARYNKLIHSVHSETLAEDDAKEQMAALDQAIAGYETAEDESKMETKNQANYNVVIKKDGETGDFDKFLDEAAEDISEEWNTSDDDSFTVSPSEGDKDEPDKPVKLFKVPIHHEDKDLINQLIADDLKYARDRYPRTVASYYKVPSYSEDQHKMMIQAINVLYNSIRFAVPIDKEGNRRPDLGNHGARVHLNISQINGFIIYLLETPELKDIARALTVSQILDLHNMNYEQAKDFVVNAKYSRMKDPIMSVIHEVQDFLTDIKTRFLQPVLSTAWQHLSNYFYSSSFNLAYQTFIISASSMLASAVVFTGIGMLGTFLLGKKKKKTKKVAQSESKTVIKCEEKEDIEKGKTQGAWTAEQGVSKTIESHLDNFAALYVVVHDGGYTYTRHPCNVCFLGKNLGLTVRHITQGIDKIREVIGDKVGTKVELVLVPFVGATLSKSTERCFVNDVKFEGNAELTSYDLAIIRFNGIRHRPKLLDLIPPSVCMEYLRKDKNLRGIFIERTVYDDLTFDGPENRVDVLFNFGRRISYESEIEHNRSVHTLDSYDYPALTMVGEKKKFVTHDGYCASAGFLVDERKNFCVKKGWPQAQQAWLCYIHTSIQGAVPHGVPLFRELFSDWEVEFSVFNVKPPVDEIKNNVKFYQDTFGECLGLTKHQSDDFELVECFDKLDINHSAVGVSNINFPQPYKTSIRRSPLHGIDPKTRVPVRMGVVKVDDEPWDVMEKQREPCGMNNVCVNGPMVDQICHQAMANVVSVSSVPEHTNLMDFEQCLYGDTAYNLNGLNWQSSGGFYLKVLKDFFKTDWKGKAWMLGPDQKLKPEVFAAVEKCFNHFDAKLQRGERIYSVAVDNIKDELLPKEKVLKGKGRLFCVYDLVYLLLSKKYFGTMAGWVYVNRIQNGMAIGVNPYSPDWDAVAEKILLNSDKCFFIDHTQFDKNQIRRIMKCLLMLATMYYGDEGSTNERVREMLLEEVINSIHVTMYKGKLYLYYWGQGNTSGNFFTCLLNCLVNICYIYICAIYAWLLFQGIEPNSLVLLPNNPANEALAIVDLGDDVVASVKDDIMPGVNFNTIIAVGKKYLNITMTDELKGGGDIPDFRSLTEGSFLGRGFVLVMINGRKRWLAPLRLYSVIERVQWIKGIYDPMVEVEKMESVFLELALHTRDVFLKYVPRYALACKEAYGIYPRFTDYELARSFVLSLSSSKYSFNDFLEGDGDYRGPNIEKILESIRNEKVRDEAINDFIDSLEGSILSNRFLTDVKSVEEEDDKPTLRRIPQSDQRSVVFDDCMDIETEGVVETLPPLWL